MRVHALMVLLSVCAIVPAQAKSAGESNALTGTWEIVDAAAAPWTMQNERPALTARGKKLVKLHITFAANAVSAKHGVFNCKKARYESASYPADAVFQAALPEPQIKFAKDLGLPPGEVPSVDVNCSTGLFSYHFLNKDTALLGYDNVIYTLKRQ
jgi:hypothetical protein